MSPNRRTPSPTLCVLAILTMGIGIMFASFGTIIALEPSGTAWGLLPLGWGMTMIISQYLGVFRGNPYGILVVCAQLALMCPLIFLLFIAGFIPAIFPLGMVIATIALNWNWGQETLIDFDSDENQVAAQKITLGEIFGAILIVSLILAPATYFLRATDF